MEARDAGKLDFPAGGVFHLTDPRLSQVLQCAQPQVHSSSCNRHSSEPAGLVLLYSVYRNAAFIYAATNRGQTVTLYQQVL